MTTLLRNFQFEMDFSFRGGREAEQLWQFVHVGEGKLPLPPPQCLYTLLSFSLSKSLSYLLLLAKGHKERHMPSSLEEGLPVPS